MTLPLGKKTYLFVLLSFFVSSALPGLCSGADDCGFSGCPPVRPPCYKVTISGLMNSFPPRDGDCVPDSNANGTWMLKRGAGDCEWHRSESPYVDIYIGEDSVVSVNIEEAFYCSDELGTGSCSNCFMCVTLPNGDCHWTKSGAGCPSFHGWDCDGIAYYEPVWDCLQCGNCSEGWVINSSPNTTIHFSNESCCPPTATGDSYTVRISYASGCSGTVYVGPEVSAHDPNLVDVKYNPNCRTGNSVSFALTPLAGPGDASTSVTCTAWFFCSDGEAVSRSVVVDVLPQCGDCCDTGKKGDPAVCPPVAGEI